jgi:hypothetical protein
MHLRMKCRNCGHWNRVAVEKIFVEQPSPERACMHDRISDSTSKSQ